MRIFFLTMALMCFVSILSAQISIFPYKESFDNVVVPALPLGWTATINKNLSGDFITSTSTVRSAPNAASSTDATKSQSLISPYFDFRGRFVDSLEFFERRTSTHLARVLVEATIDHDTVFGIKISPDSLRFVSGTSYIRRIFSLPETLSGRNNVRFRIRIIRDSIGSSGIYRIDDVRLTVKKSIDFALSSCAFSPSAVKDGDRLAVSVGIKNLALAGYYSGTIRLFDSLTLVSTQIFSRSFAVHESLTVVLNYPNIRFGRHPLTAVLTVNGDEDTTNNSMPVVINAGFRRRTMLINEIMYTPTAGMPEWIEIVNNSPDSIPVSGWKISDAGTNRSAMLPSYRYIAAHTFFIVTTDTNAFKNFYETPVLLFQSSFSALNNSGDAVILYDHTNAVIDSLTFYPLWGGGTGKSLERIDTATASTDQFNWSTSKHHSGSTPGTINSVAQKPFDVAVTRMSVSPQFPAAGETVLITSVIKNIGKQIVPLMRVELYADVNKDSVLSTDELKQQQILSFITSNDSAIVQMNLASVSQGTHWLVTKVSPSQDDDTANNTLLFPLTVGIPPQSIIINEIMYAPPGDMPEWIEGYNKTSSSITIGGWRISDNGSTKAFIESGQPNISSNSYFIITTDTNQFKNFFPAASLLFQAAFPSLNNTTPDAVVLYDNRGMTMDSVQYRPLWGGVNGNSLQRFDIHSSLSDSVNWRSAVPNAGNENTIARKDFDVELKRITWTNRSNGISIRTTLVNTGRNNANSVSIQLFHDINRDSLAQASELLSSSTVPTIGPMDSAAVTFEWNAPPQGKQYIFAAIDFPQDERMYNNSMVATVMKNYSPQSMVINEIMYEPESGKAEFVELLNRGNDTIDIADWKLMDQSGATGNRTIMQLSKVPLLLPPRGFVVLSSDSSFFDQFPGLIGQPVIIHPSLNLNNSGEDIVLVDLTGMQIDSVHYFPSWHLKNFTASGRSLERINPASPSNDDRNWSSSVAKNGSSPMLSNSIFIGSVAGSSSLSLTPNPFSPDRDGSEDFLSINYALPANSTAIRVRIFDVTGRLVRRLAQGEPSPSSGSVLWNGCDDDGHRVRIGMYIILFEALDNFGGVAKTMKDVAVVGRKL